MMPKHLKELMVDTELYSWELAEPTMQCGYNSLKMAGPNGHTAG